MEGSNLVKLAASACLALDKIIHVYREQLHVHRSLGPGYFITINIIGSLLILSAHAWQYLVCVSKIY
jgi:dTDP-D-glucose 4,6-dehydratase